MLDRDFKNFLIGIVSNVVRDIKENVFKVRVENQIKFPEEIKVSNQKDTQEVSGEITVKDLDRAIKTLDEMSKKEFEFPKYPDEIKVKHLDKLINKKDVVIPDEFIIKNIDSVVKVLEDIKSKKYPEQKEIKFPNSFEISNLKDIPMAENMKVHKLDNLIKSIENIGSLNRDEKNPIPVRLSDGKYFYKALDKVVDKVISAGGVNNVGLRNILNARINPSTEENQDTANTILTSLASTVTNAIEEVAFDLNASAFSQATNISNDYKFDNISFKFSTVEERTITITASNGTILHQITNTSQNFTITDKRYFNGGDNITVAITQLSSAGTVSVTMVIVQGSEILTGNPVLGAGNEIIGKVKITNGTEEAGIHDGAILTMDYATAQAHGLISTDTVEFAVGKKNAIGTGAYTLLESQAFVQPPDTPGDIQMYVQSTSAQDGVGGTGVQEFTIKYFSKAWGARKSQVVVMNGTTQVAIPNIDKYRIHKVYANKGSRAVGNITITNQAATIEYGRIEQYESFMRRCIFYIAENETVIVTQAIIGSKTSGGVNVVCFVSEEDDSQNVIARGRATIGLSDSAIVVTFKPEIIISNPNNLRKAVGLSVKGDSANQKCIGTLLGTLEE